MIDPHSITYGALGGGVGVAGILMLFKDGARELISGIIDALKSRGAGHNQMFGELIAILRTDLSTNREILSKMAAAQIEAAQDMRALAENARWSHDILLEIKGQKNGRKYE